MRPLRLERHLLVRAERALDGPYVADLSRVLDLAVVRFTETERARGEWYTLAELEGVETSAA